MAQVIITSLDMVPGDVQERVYISQSDTGFRELQFYLYARGSLYEIPAGAAAVLNGRKPDSTAFSYPMTIIDSHTVKLAVQQQMSSVAGDVKCEVAIIAASEKIGSANFILHVEEAPIAAAVMSESDYALFIEAIDAAGSIASVEQIVDDLNNLEAQITADEAQMNLWMRLGSLIVADSDLIAGAIPANPGKYYVSNASLAQTLRNCPTQLGFALWVTAQTSTNARVLLLIDASGDIYIDRLINEGTGYDVTSHTGWKRLLNTADLSDLNHAINHLGAELWNEIEQKAPELSPIFSGMPSTPTPDGTDRMQIANVDFVNLSISNISNASQLERGMMSAADKKYLDESAILNYNFVRSGAAGVSVEEGSSCFVSLRQGNYANIELHMKIVVEEGATVPALSHIAENLPKPRGANPPCLLMSRNGDQSVVGYVSSAGNFVNVTSLTAGKTYYGSLQYSSKDANSWYDLLG